MWGRRLTEFTSKTTLLLKAFNLSTDAHGMNAELLDVVFVCLLANAALCWTLLRRRRTSSPVFRVGIDLVEVEIIAATLRSGSADRYLSRVYTDQEVRDCMNLSGDVDAARLAGRFAAKEAAMKAIGVGDRAVPWCAIEVRRSAGGQPTLLLQGQAAVIAREAGVSKFALSLSHERNYASAMVVASA